MRRVDVVQYGWNMFDRRMQREILPLLRGAGVGFMAYGSLAYGLLTGTFTEDMDFGSADWRARQGNMGSIKIFDALFGPEKFPHNVRAVEELKGVAARYGKSLPQLALRWAISNPAVSTALVGCRTVAEVEDNVGAIGWSISDADLAEIDAIFDAPRRRHHPRLLDRGRLSRRTREHSAELAGKVAIVTGGAERPRPRRSSSGSWRRARRSSSRTSTRDGGEALAARARCRGRVQADRRRRRRRRSRRSSTSRSSASAACTSCATTPGSRVVQSRFLDDDFDDFDRVMGVNIFGVMVGSQRAARHMAEQRRRRDRQHHVDRRDQRRRRA